MRLRSAILIVIGACSLFGQAAQKHLSFEVASVKANVSDDPSTDYIPRLSGNRVAMHNADLISVVAWAHHLTNQNYQLAANRWEKALWDSYDIEALASDPPSDDDLRLMFQALLEDRFQLKVHWETRELPAYDLVAARSGAKLVRAKPGARVSMGTGGSACWIALEADGSHLVGHGASLEELAVVLSGKLKAPVQDRTGIAGMFDYDVAFAQSPDTPDVPVLTSAIRELGLNLEKSKGRFEVLVIDHLEKPSQN